MVTQEPPLQDKALSKKPSSGAWVIIVSLVGILAASAVGFWVAATVGHLPEISVHGWVAMGIGTFFSLLIGCGLMWLSFYSARQGFDDRADPGRMRETEVRVD
jgi:protein-S-isoprenylcysteine O-methyltransferase Ste14